MKHTCVVEPEADLVLPGVCVVCGGEAGEEVRYSQDNFPIFGPGFAYVSWRDVTFPYCDEHARRFKRRFLLLRVYQAVFFLLGMGLILVGMALTNRDVAMILNLRLSIETATAVFGMPGLALIGLSALSLIAKPFLYDATVSVAGRRFRFRARSREFI
ncbi:MAG: hypothetical protein ACYS9X_18605 [Planctomycetota bacterium]|jgi:hypothetical protein